MSQPPADPFDKLRPPLPTPAGELCSCGGAPPIKLMPSLGSNPICCVRCNREVDPESFPLGPDLADTIGLWNQVYVAIYHLWITSVDAYVDWAGRQLEDLDGYVNKVGRELCSEINDTRTCYYSLFDDTSGPSFIPRENCPYCRSKLIDVAESYPEIRICEECLIATWAHS